MKHLLLSSIIISLVNFINARAVNITSSWFLPEENFPVFYRYFKDKVTWNEAAAICEFHHAQLITLSTNTEVDAAIAYLKELDVVNEIWIGLKKLSPEKPFAWMNDEELTGDGYWLNPIPKSEQQLCTALDPAANYRWTVYSCPGPQATPFICELPVPDWAMREDGCMITNLPSLTITLLPELGAVELASDCGLDGTRRIACKGGIDREEMIKRLSCEREDETGTSTSTTDLTRESSGTYQHSVSSHTKDSTVPVTRGWSWDPYEPQTRHKRDTNPSSPGTPQSTDTPSTAQVEESTWLPQHTNTMLPEYVGEIQAEKVEDVAPTSLKEEGQTEQNTEHPDEQVEVVQEERVEEGNPTSDAEWIDRLEEKPPTIDIQISSFQEEQKVISPPEFTKEVKIVTEAPEIFESKLAKMRKKPDYSNEQLLTNNVEDQFDLEQVQEKTVPVMIVVEEPSTTTIAPKTTEIVAKSQEIIAQQNFTKEDVELVITETVNATVQEGTDVPCTAKDVVQDIREEENSTTVISEEVVAQQSVVEENKTKTEVKENMEATEQSLEPTEGQDNDSSATAAVTKVSLINQTEEVSLNKSEPFIISLNDDIVLNNPSLSPLEVIDVEVAIVDSSTLSTQDGPEDVIRIVVSEEADEKQNQTGKNMTAATNIEGEMLDRAVSLPMVQETENIGEVEEEKGEEVEEVLQKPNRGRLLAHANRLPFYPYFLNRVLG